MRWMLRGAEACDPSTGLHGIVDILMEDERILNVGPHLSPGEDVHVEEADGWVVIPGVIDMHAHLRQPGQDDRETVRSGGRAAVQGGVTAVAAMPNTDPPVDDEATVGYVLHKAEESPAEVFPIACVTRGQKGTQLVEMATLREAGAVAFSDDGKPVASAEIMRRALEYARMLDCAVLDHCEDPTLTCGGCINESFTSTTLGLRGMPTVAEDVMVARNCMLAEMTGGHVHICHLSSARSVDIVRAAKARGVRVTAEVTPHHLLLTDEWLRNYDTRGKVNPPLRTSEDMEAVIQGLADGTIDCIASDHAPHTREDKEMEFDRAPFGISGVQTMVPLMFSELVRKGRVSRETVVRALTHNPARVLRLPQGYGSIKAGGVANLTILDPIAPLRVDINAYETKGKNSPFHGWSLVGSPMMTVVRGRIVMREGRVVNEALAARTPQPVLLQ